MKKQFIIITLIILLLSIGLNGCLNNNENDENKKTLPDGTVATGDIDKVDVLSYNVTTKWDTGDIMTGIIKHNASGFYQFTDEDAYSRRYIIDVVIKNIAGYKLDYIALTVLYYDNQGNEIGPGNVLLNRDITTNLPNTYTATLDIDWWETWGGYFDQVDHIEFYVTTELEL